MFKKKSLFVIFFTILFMLLKYSYSYTPFTFTNIWGIKIITLYFIGHINLIFFFNPISTSFYDSV